MVMLLDSHPSVLTQAPGKRTPFRSRPPLPSSQYQPRCAPDDGYQEPRAVENISVHVIHRSYLPSLGVSYQCRLVHWDLAPGTCQCLSSAEESKPQPHEGFLKV